MESHHPENLTVSWTPFLVSILLGEPGWILTCDVWGWYNKETG